MYLRNLVPTYMKAWGMFGNYYWRQIFHTTWLHFIGNPHHVNTIMILGKSLLKSKKAHIYTKRRQIPWFKLIAHHLIFWLMIQVYESHRGNFGSCGLEGQEVCSVKLKWFKVDKGKHVAWHVFPNSLNSDESVCNK